MKEYICIPKGDYVTLCAIIDRLAELVKETRSTKNPRAKYTVIRLEK